MFKYDYKISFEENTSYGKIIKHLEKGSRVLEFGCATGEMSAYMTEKLGCEVWGIEIDKGAAEKAAAHQEKTICCDAETLSWAEDIKGVSFDAVIFADVLEHLRCPEKVLKKAAEFLSDEGKVIVSLPNIAHADVISKLVANRFDYTPTGLLDNTHIHFWGSENLKELFEQAGLFFALLDGVTKPAGGSEQADPRINASIREFIASKPFADLYQFVCVAYKKSYADKKNMTFEAPAGNNDLSSVDSYVREKNLTSASHTANVYFDTGDGFSDLNRYTFTYKTNSVSTVRISVPEGCRAIRFDPTEDSFPVVPSLRILSNKGVLEAKGANEYYKNGELYFFETTDPQFTAECPDNVSWIEIDFEIINCTDATSFSVIKKLIDEAVWFRSDAQRINKEYGDYKTYSENYMGETIKAKDSEYSKLRAESEIALAEQKAKSETELALLRAELERKTAEAEKAAGEYELAVNRGHSLLNAEKKKAEYEKKRLLEKLNAVTESLEEYKREYGAAIEHKNRLENDTAALSGEVNRLAGYEVMYNSVTASTSWKMTAPIRKTLDIAKKLVRGDGTAGEEVSSDAAGEAAPAAAVCTVPQDVRFSILMPIGGNDTDGFRATAESIIAQEYGNWQLIIGGKSGISQDAERIACELAGKDGRIKYIRPDKKGGRAYMLRKCAEFSDGDYILAAECGDLFGSSALKQFAAAVYETNTNILYSDEEIIFADGSRAVRCKPDWSPDLFFRRDYFSRYAIKRTVFNKAGGYCSNGDCDPRFELLLRALERTKKVCHVPVAVIARADKEELRGAAEKKALSEYLEKKYGSEARLENSSLKGVSDVRFDNMKHNPLVSVIIPMKDKWEMTEACINSITEKSSYSNYELLILDNRSEEKATFDWFRKAEKKDKRIRVIKADMEFNWSKLNNFGISHAKGEVYIFLNNDTIVISPDWIERLCENALRPDIGAVGAQLLYEDGTLQHAGVVVGMGGWADHIFKGMAPEDKTGLFISPAVSRNVLAVTGACMAISKKTVEEIGGFDETFIICGSDVEMCIRAFECGRRNLYNADVKLYHLESKSRDTYVPEVDFKRSYECYTPYRENIDPYFSINLDINSVIPAEKPADVQTVNYANFADVCGLERSVYEKRISYRSHIYHIDEAGDMRIRPDEKLGDRLRLNLMIPTVDPKSVFGGIATALKFFYSLKDAADCDVRVISTDSMVDMDSTVLGPEYEYVPIDETSGSRMQVTSFCNRLGSTLAVGKNDIFVATAWWTAYCAKKVVKRQAEIYSQEMKPLIYLVQDYEPGFYPWSTRFALSESTYRMDIPVFAVFNSGELKEYFDNNGYSFTRSWCFEPFLNGKLSEFLPVDKKTVRKKKQILIYGRPSVTRNAFITIITALTKWAGMQDDPDEWTILSAGELHDDLDLGEGVIVHSTGKLTLEEYAQTLLDTYAGISLMISPHPSYPPLEMAAFGVRCITNRYANKDLASFSDNIISLEICEPDAAAEKLYEITSSFAGEGRPMTKGPYIEGSSVFGDIAKDIISKL